MQSLTSIGSAPPIETGLALLQAGRLAEAAPETKVSWLIRGDNPAKAFGGGANDALAARGALGSLLARLVSENRIAIEAAFRVSDLAATPHGLRIAAGSACCGRNIVVDELIVATGFRPDLAILSELRAALDPALACPPVWALVRPAHRWHAPEWDRFGTPVVPCQIRLS